MNVTNTETLISHGFVSTGALDMYYQIHGPESEDPLLLLHGGLTTIESSFEALIPRLATGRRVIAVEQQGHGRTADIDRSMDFALMADDTAVLLHELGVAQVDSFGYSDGGNVALGLAIRHPTLVRRVAIAGTNYSVDGMQPEILEMMASATAAEMPDELRREFERVAPHPEQWSRIVKKVMHMGTQFPGWTKSDLQEIRQPVLVMVGDRDIVRPDHALELYKLLPNGQLGILPGTDHGLNLENPVLLLSLLTDFLSAADQVGAPAT